MERQISLAYICMIYVYIFPRSKRMTGLDLLLGTFYSKIRSKHHCFKSKHE